MSALNPSSPSRNAYVTLLTRPSYLAGAITLAYTLHKHSPSTPLIITYTPDTFPQPTVAALAAEAKHSNIILRSVEHLRLPEDGTEHGMVAERFIDTWTKLRVFDLWDLEERFERICWLDADMMIFSDPSPLIFNAENDAYLEDGDAMRIMAVHTCVCNLDHDSWAPSSWVPQNCALTHLSSPSDIAPVSVSPATLSNFNSGTFLYRPTKALAEHVHAKFEELGNARLKAMKFPDQDFLNEAFDGRWKSLSWRTNALKTWRYWHPAIWRDNMVAVLHYIVDKPWVKRIGEDGVAGYLGGDGETHGWWWDEFGKWEMERKAQGESELLEVVGRYMASADGRENEEMTAIGGGAQDFAKKWAGGERKGEEKETNEEGKKEDGGKIKQDGGKEVGGPVLRKKIPGERGHGPVVRGGLGGGRGGGGGWSVMQD